MYYSREENSKHIEAYSPDPNEHHPSVDSVISMPASLLPHPKESHKDLSLYDEIKVIWEKNGFKRHSKPDPDEREIEASMDFSFSPYDNFF